MADCSDCDYMLDTLTQLASVKEHVEKVNKSNESVSWVLIGTPFLQESDNTCRVLIMQVIQNGNVWEDLLGLLVENKIFYCYIKIECIDLRGSFQKFLIHWTGAKVPKDNIASRSSHFEQIQNVVGVPDNIIKTRDHTVLINKITSRLTRLEEISDKYRTLETLTTHSVNKQPRLGIKTRESNLVDGINVKPSTHNMKPFYTASFKMCIIGDPNVGKSSILKSFEEGRGLEYNERPSNTVGYDCFFHHFSIPNTNTDCEVTIWDTAGSERFKSMSVMLFRDSHVVVMVYDISDFESFEAIPTWHAEVRQYVDDRAIFMLVGNKLDLHERREVPQRIAQNYAKKNRFEYFECSTTQGSNIFHLFNQIEKSIQSVYSDKLVHPLTRKDSIRIVLDADSPSKSRCCLSLRKRTSSTD